MREQQVEVEEVNYAKAPLSEAVIASIVAKAGSVAAVMNARHATVKANGWVDKPPSAAVFAAAAAKEPNLLRRPIFVDGKKIIVGFDRDAYGALAKRT